LKTRRCNILVLLTKIKSQLTKKKSKSKVNQLYQDIIIKTKQKAKK